MGSDMKSVVRCFQCPWYFAYVFQTNVTSQEPRHAITGLAAGEKYQICVMTVTTKGDSPFSDILSVATDDLEITELEKLKKALGIDIINDNIVRK